MPARFLARRTLSLLSLALGAFGIAVACSSGGGPVTGPADSHCGSKAQVTSQAVCKGAGGGSSSSSSSSSGAGGGGDVDDYGPTLDNAEGDDDECKYHVKW